MTTAAPLILLGALSRLFPHPPNAIAIGAIVLSSVARLARRLALAVPLAALAPDLSIDFATGRRAITLVQAGEWRSATSWRERRDSRA